MFSKFRNIHNIIYSFSEYKDCNVGHSEMLKNKTVELGIKSDYGKYIGLKKLINSNKEFSQLCAKIDMTYESKSFILAEEDTKKHIFVENVKLKINKLIETLDKFGLPVIVRIIPSNHSRGMGTEEYSFTEIISSLEFQISGISDEYFKKFKLLEEDTLLFSELPPNLLVSILSLFVSRTRFHPEFIMNFVEHANQDILIVDSIESFNKILE